MIRGPPRPTLIPYTTLFRSFLGGAAREIVARPTLDPVLPLRARRPALPAAVERAAFKALAKTPADRFPTAGAFGDALTAAPAVPSSRWWARRAARYAAAVALLAVGSVLFWRRPIGRDTPSRGSARSIAVLPFANLSGDRNDEYFSDGMSEELITALHAVPGLRVAARTSAFAFRDRNVNAGEIGKELNVATLLEGSVRRAGSRVRDRKSTRLNSSHDQISYAVFCLKKKKKKPSKLGLRRIS